MVKITLDDEHMEPIVVLLLKFEKECEQARVAETKKGKKLEEYPAIYYENLPKLRVETAKKIANACADIIRKNSA